VTDNTAFDAYDTDSSKRIKKALASQIAAYVRSKTEASSESNTNITTVGAGTLTAAALVGGSPDSSRSSSLRIAATLAA